MCVDQYAVDFMDPGYRITGTGPAGMTFFDIASTDRYLCIVVLEAKINADRRAAQL
jgi:hypothetical protein